jgi:VIT1/CCC1 family predicted Fe2+/Mn2+ transporter
VTYTAHSKKKQSDAKNEGEQGERITLSEGRLVVNRGFRELAKEGKLDRERRKAYLSRLSMAYFGGLALVVPMLIMALHKELVVSLVTTSVATAIFAIVIALWSTYASGKDVLASTAAYTAVLVVFVGASS